VPKRIEEAVIAVFSSRVQARDAVRELLRREFTEAEIGVASKRDRGRTSTTSDKTAEALANGITSGAMMGLGAGVLWGIGISTGVLPSISPVIAGGSLVAIAASAVTGAAAAAGIGGALNSVGLSEADAEFYEKEFSQGQMIVTVRTNSRTDEAECVLTQFNGTVRTITSSPFEIRITTSSGASDLLA